MSSALLNRQSVKAEALRLGFSACGLAPAEAVQEPYASRFLQWIQKGCQANMSYMENHIQMRLDPRLLVPGVKTIISVALNYYPSKQASGLSMYAQGQDYHEVVRERLHQLLEALNVEGRCFVDTAPVLERYWAWRAGLGWMGRNTLLILPHHGSTYFLGELFVMAEADSYDTPLARSCGDCHRCIEACPMGAISETGIDARRCISYLTIENRGPLPQELTLEDCFYGCDRCQQACPHLQHAIPTSEEAFLPSKEILEMSPSEWKNLTLEQYQHLFKGSAVKRAKFDGLKRNIEACKFHPE
ncbi:MAG: tRNA epoxyqueuosine(34) reductase QueG [Bacteroidaceae bacterium]|nr:tRNA epoxyqueuosine(34) reductase QueG [Bacteroidaceae bacterium]